MNNKNPSGIIVMVQPSFHSDLDENGRPIKFEYSTDGYRKAHTRYYWGRKDAPHLPDRNKECDIHGKLLEEVG